MTKHSIRVSVCMATYNGARYIREQLDSILPQLTGEDELIVSDDNSTDYTRQIIWGYEDPRIIPGVNPGKRGHVQNFANAMSQAKGEFIALSDQDDIWVAGRLEKMLARLQETRCALLIGDSEELGGNKLPPLAPWPSNRLAALARIFRGNIRCFGCTFLMTADLARACLPIPPYIEAHDIWIAMNAAAFGSISHLEEVVTLRRVHGNNLTPFQRRSLRKIAKSRFGYARGLLTAVPSD